MSDSSEHRRPDGDGHIPQACFPKPTYANGHDNRGAGSEPADALTQRIALIRQRLDAWRANCAEDGGNEDYIKIFEVHSSDDVAWLLDNLSAARAARHQAEQRMEAMRQSTDRDELIDRIEALFLALTAALRERDEAQQGILASEQENIALKQQLAATERTGAALRALAEGWKIESTITGSRDPARLQMLACADELLATLARMDIPGSL